jgi:hypothetical protein
MDFFLRSFDEEKYRELLWTCVCFLCCGEVCACARTCMRLHKIPAPLQTSNKTMNRLTRCTRPFHTLSQHFSDSTSVYTPFTTSKLDLSSIPPHIPSKPPPPKPKGGRRKPLRKRLKPLRIFLRPLETYNPPVPPRSPLLDVDIFLPYSKTHPKAPPTKGDELSPREWALRLNPYGTPPPASQGNEGLMG